ncbi:olfactory receptor 5B21-like [Zonotrichia leucophrys gambelii]|uniref:olfactory receptor 5B21-like n=1 Tax=Zonotrichia leucophrys gambelii TaxID=257770 RepID=UPI00314034C5
MAANGNGSTSAHFVLLGFSEQGHVQVVLFVVLLVLHVITLLGNAGLLVLISLLAQLHTPMYFFLSSQSFLELCYSSCITPRLLWALLHEDKAISHTECLMQFYFYVAFATTECCLLAAMAYDRCVAVCHPCSTPVHVPRSRHAKVSEPPDRVFGNSGHPDGCTEFRHQGICACLVAGFCLVGVTNAALHTGLALRLSFCSPKGIDHFYCQGTPLFALSCLDPVPNKLGTFLMAGFSLAATILAILLSYALSLAAIILAILLSYTAAGKRKAFSTCASHLAAVALFHGSLVSMYCWRSSSSSRQPDNVASVFYTMVMPMLNPFICSLRNQEVKARLWRLMGRKHSAEK